MDKLISKFTRIAREGETTDGRNITREHIEQMSKNYNRKTYGARIWLEHLRGLFADGPFQALGDVMAVKSQEEDGKLGLYAQLAPTPNLVEMNRKSQKIFTSIEMNPNFSDTGEAYLVGLGVTDSPASLGTEVLAFSSKAEHSIFDERKQQPENVFSAATENVLEFDEVKDEDDKPSLFSKVVGMLNKNKHESDDHFADMNAAIEEIARVAGNGFDAVDDMQTTLDEFNNKHKTLEKSHKELAKNFTDLITKLDGTDSFTHRARQEASGGDGEIVTDC